MHERLRTAVGDRSYRHIAELTGSNHESVRRYLSGQAPSVEFLTALSRALGLSSEWLLTGRGPMKLEEVRVAALRQSPAPDLLQALAHTVEELLQRIDRLERYMQTMEARVRAGSPPPTPATRDAHDHPAAVVLSERVARLADVLPERPPPAAG